MLTTTEGTVISVREQGDNDLILKVLSPEMGLIEITCKGVKKQNASGRAAAQLFACSKLCFNERNGRYYLNSSEPIRSFYGLRLDMKKLSLASYFAEMISYTVTEGQSANDIYRLFMNCLYMITERNASCDFIKFIFEMRVTADLGMMPGLLGCHECYCGCGEKPLYFLIDRGIFLCREHLRSASQLYNGYTEEVTAGMLEAMRFVCLSDIGSIFNFRVSEQSLERLCSISERYASEQLNRYFKTLDFYKNI